MSRKREPADDDFDVADRLHSAAIHILRRLRVRDRDSDLSGPRLSALSVVVFGGPLTITELADAEQVRPPTISRMVGELEKQGLVRRHRDTSDRRVQRVEATDAGRRLLQQGRERRVRALAERLASLPAEERRRIRGAVPALEHLALPADYPGPEPD